MFGWQQAAGYTFRYDFSYDHIALFLPLKRVSGHDYYQNVVVIVLYVYYLYICQSVSVGQLSQQHHMNSDSYEKEIENNISTDRVPRQTSA